MLKASRLDYLVKIYGRYNIKILVTGANGYLGSYLIPRLQGSGCELTTLSPTITKYPDIFHKRHNIDDSEQVKFHYLKPDKIIHMAWGYLNNYENPYHINHALNHVAFLKNMINSGVDDITIIGTCQEYGMKNGMCKVSTPTDPVTMYGIGKDLLRRLMFKVKSDIKWIRIFNIYPDGKPKPKTIFSELKNANGIFNMTQGEQLRDYLHVDDVIDKIIEVAMGSKTGIFNCCSGKPITVKSVVNKYVRKHYLNVKFNYNLEYRKNEPMALYGECN